MTDTVESWPRWAHRGVDVHDEYDYQVEKGGGGDAKIRWKRKRRRRREEKDEKHGDQTIIQRRVFAFVREFPCFCKF